MVLYPIPHTAKYIPAVSSFSAPLVAGQYDLAQAANTNVTVIELQANVSYFLSNFSFAGIMSQETYLESVDTTPQVVFTRRNDGQNVYNGAIRLLQFQAIMDAGVFVKSDKRNDALLVTLTGVLNQTADLIGIDPVTLAITYNIFEISETEFNKAFRDKINPSFAMRLNS